MFSRLDVVATISASPPSMKSNSDMDITLHTQIKSVHTSIETNQTSPQDNQTSVINNQTSQTHQTNQTNQTNPLSNPPSNQSNQSNQSNASNQSNQSELQGEPQGNESTAPLYTAEIAADSNANADANPIDAPSSISQSMLDVLSNIEEFDKIEAEAQSTSDVSGIASTVSTSKPPLQFQGELPLRNQEAMRLVSMKQGGQDHAYAMVNNQGTPVQNGFAMKRNSAFISF